VTYTPVGSGASSITGNGGAGALGTFSLVTSGVGNYVLCCVISSGGSRTATALSSSHATWVAVGSPVTTSNLTARCQMFRGTVTSATTATVTVTWGAGTTGSFEGCARMEFASDTGAPVFVAQATLDSAGANTWPALSGAGMYFGYALNQTSSGTVSTGGWTSNGSPDGQNNGAAYNQNYATSGSPTWTDSGQSAGLMVLVGPAGAAPVAGPAGPPPLGWLPPMAGVFGPAEPFATRGFSLDPAPSVTVNAPAAAAQASAPNPAFRLFIAGLGGSGYNSWFTDQNGNPRLAVVEQGWGLAFNAGRWGGRTPHQDFDLYFSTRAAQGYTAWYGPAHGSTHVDSSALSGGRSWDGVYPLTVNGTPGAIATGAETVGLNNTFWSRIDDMFATAKSYGVACFLNMGLTYDFSDTGAIWRFATNTQGQAFGAALASRYPQSSYPHVHWFFDDDGGGGNDSFWSAVLTGMASSGDTRAALAIEYQTNCNSHIQFSSGAAIGTFGAAHAGYNWVYSYDAPYFGTEQSYNEGGSFAHICALYGDGIFYGDSGGGPSVETAIRTFTWWALASGSRGFPSTSGPSFADADALWMWATTNAPGRLTSDPNGSWCTTNVKRIADYFSGLPDWHKLIPDTGNVFVTAGRGTRGTCDVAGSGFNVRAGNGYVAASITPAGTLAVLYCRAAMSITIDQTKMVSGYSATWVDPSNPTLTSSATPGSTYNSGPNGNNAAGQPDWVLVLQAPPSVSVAAPAAAATATAPAPSEAIGATAGVPTALAGAVNPTILTATSVAAPAAGALASAPGPVAGIGAVAGVPTALAGAVNPAVTTAAGTTVNAPAPAGLASAPAPVTAVGIPAPAPAGAASAPAPSLTTAAQVAAGIPTALAGAASPTVSTSAATNVPAPVAAAQATAPAPVPAIGVTPAAPTGLAAAPGPAVQSASAPHPGAPAALASAPAPTLTTAAAVTVPAPAAAASAPAPSLATAAAVPAPVPTGLAGAANPAVTTSAAATVNAPAVAAQAAAPGPVIAAGVTASVPTGLAGAANPAVNTSSSTTVNAPAVAALASAPGPSVSSAVLPAAGAAAAAAAASAPAVVSAAAVPAPAVAGSATAPAPVVAIGVSPAAAAAVAAAPAPAPTAVSAQHPAAPTALAGAVNPTISVVPSVQVFPPAAGGVASAPAVTFIQSSNVPAPAAAALAIAPPATGQAARLVFPAAALALAAAANPGTVKAVLLATPPAAAAAAAPGPVVHAVVPAVFGEATTAGGAGVAVITAGDGAEQAVTAGAGAKQATTTGRP
jgi:hypothetical protein